MAVPKSRMTRSKMLSYMRNVGRSFGYAMVDSVSSMNPTVTALFKSTAEQSKELYSSVKNFDAKSLGFESEDLKGTIFQGIKDIKKNALDDIRTGKWYNKERINKYNDEMAEDMLGINFDDFGNFDDFDFDDTDLDEEASISEDATRATAEAMDKVGAKVSGAVSTAAIQSADYIVESSRANTKALYNLNLTAFGQVNKGIAAMNGNLQLLVSLAEPLTTHMQNSALFYTQTQEYHSKALDYLKQIAANTTPKSSSAGFKSGTRSKGYMDYITSEGVIDFQSLIMDGGKRIKENTELITSMLGMIPGGEKAIIKMASGSPLQFALTAAIGSMFNVKGKNGRSIRDSFEDFNKILSNFSVGLLGKAKRASFGDNLFSPFLRGIRDFLLPDNKVIKKPNVGNYEKGKVDWDGMSRKALMDVIPTQLSQILSALTGEPERRFDYNTGRWVKVSTIRSNRERDLKNITNRAGGDLFKTVGKSVDKSSMSNRDKKRYKKQLEAFLQQAVMSGNDNFLDFLSEDFNFSKFGMSDAVGKDLQRRIRYIGNTANGQRQLSEFAGNVYQARSNISRRNSNVQGAEATLFDKSTKRPGGRLIDMKDEYGFSQNDYLRNILGHVSYISKNLKNLIRVPGVGGYSQNGSQITWEEGDWITKSSDRISRPNSNSDRIDRDPRIVSDDDMKKSVDDAMYRSDGPDFSDKEREYIKNGYKDKNGNKDDAIEDSIQRKREIYDLSQKGRSFLSGAYDRLKNTKAGGSIEKMQQELGLATDNVTKALDEMSAGLNKFIYDKDFGLYHLMNTMTMGMLDMVKELIPRPIREGIGKLWGRFKESEFGKATFGTLRDIGLSFFGKKKKEKEYDAPDVGLQFTPVDDEDFVELPPAMGSGLVNKVYSRMKRNQIRGGNFWGKYNRGSFSGKASGIYVRPRRVSPRARSRRTGFSGGATGAAADEEAASEEDIEDEVEADSSGALKSVLATAGKSLGNKLFRTVSKVLGKTEDDENKIKDKLSKMAEEAGLGKGAIGAGAFIGGGVSLLTGAFLGPIAGAAIGAAAGFVAKSETAQNFLFGKYDKETGEQIEAGKLPKGISDFFMKNAKSTGMGAGAGLAIGTLMGSPVLGAVLGATAGYVKSSEHAQEVLFGAKDGEGNRQGGVVPKAFLDFIKDKVPVMATGAGAALLFAPGPLIPKLAAGAILGIITSDNKDSIKSWFKESIVSPLAEAIHPITVEIKNKGTDLIRWTIRSIAGVFEKATAVPLFKVLNEQLVKPLANKLIPGLVKGVGGIIASPFQAIGAFGRKLRRKQIRTGRANDMSAKERLRYRRVNGLNDDEFVDFDNTLSEMSTDDIDLMLDSIKSARQSKDSDRIKDEINKFSTKFGLQNVDVNEKNIDKWLDTVKAEAKNRDRTPEGIMKEAQIQRDKLIENHYNRIEDMLGNLVNHFVGYEAYKVTTNIKDDTSEESTEESSTEEASTAQNAIRSRTNTRRNFGTVVKSIFNPFIGMDMDSVQDAIEYYEEELEGSNISSKFVGREQELKERVRKVTVNGRLRDDVIQVTDKNGYTVTVQKFEGSWVPYQLGKQLFSTVENTRVGRAIKSVYHGVKGLAKGIYSFIIDDPFSILNQDDVMRIEWTYIQLNFPDEARGSLPTDDELEFFNKHCKVLDSDLHIIRITDTEGNQAIGQYDKDLFKWKRVNPFKRAYVSVKNSIRSIKQGFKNAAKAIKAVGKEIMKRADPFCDFEDADELQRILENLNAMEFYGASDETGCIYPIPNLNHYYSIRSKVNGATTVVTNRGGKWVYVSMKALELAKTKRMIAGIGGVAKNLASKVFHKLTGNKLRSNHANTNKFFKKQEEEYNEKEVSKYDDEYENMFEDQYDNDDTGIPDLLGEDGKGSGLIKRLGFSGRGIIDDPNVEQDENASNILRQRRKDRNSFLGGIAAIPTLGSKLDRVVDALEDIKDSLGGEGKEKKKSLFDKIKDALIGEDGLFGGLLGFFTGSTGIGGTVGKLLGKFSLSSALVKGAGLGLLYTALTGGFNDLFTHLKTGSNDPNGDNGLTDTITNQKKEGVTQLKNDENGDGSSEDETAATKGLDYYTNNIGQRVKVGSNNTIQSGLWKNIGSGLIMGKSSVASVAIKKITGLNITTQGLTKGLGKLAENGISSGTINSICSALGSIFGKICRGLTKLPVVGKLIEDPNSIAAGIVNKMRTEIEKVGQSAALKKAAGLLQNALIALKVAYIAGRIIDAWGNAETILGITEEATLGQRFVAALIGGTNAAIPFIGDLIPDKVLVDIFMWVAEKLGLPGVEGLKSQRDKATEDVAAYIEATGDDSMTIEKYNQLGYIRNEDGSFTQGKARAGLITQTKMKVGKFIDNVKEKGLGTTLSESKVGKAMSTAGKSIAETAGKFGEKVKETGSNFLDLGKQLGQYVTKGDIIGLWTSKYNQSEDRDNPLGGFMNVIYTLGKMQFSVPTLISAVGHGIYDKFNRIVEGAKILFEGVKTQSKYAEEALYGEEGYSITKLFDVSNLEGVSDDNPFAPVTKALSLVERLIAVPIVSIKHQFGQMKDWFGKIGTGIVTAYHNYDNMQNQLNEKIQEGSMKELISSEYTDEDGNPMGGFFGVLYNIKKIANVPIAGLIGLGHSIGDWFKEKIDNAKQDVDRFGFLNQLFKEQAEKGEAGDIIKQDSNYNGSLITGLLEIGTGISKLFYSAIAIFNKFIGPLKTTVENVTGGISGWVQGAANWVGDKVNSVNNWADTKKAQFNEAVHGTATPTSGGYSGVVSQLDPRFAKYSVGGRSFAANGCGPASAVMALGGNVGDAVNIAQKYQTRGGTDAAYFGEMFNRQGMRANYYLAGGSSLLGDIASGKPTVLMGRDPSNTSKAYSPFGPNNHYVVANGFDNSGRLLISDPEQSRVRAYDPNILRNVKVGVSGGASAINTQIDQTPKSTTSNSNYRTFGGVVMNTATGETRQTKGYGDWQAKNETPGTSNLPMTTENCANENLGVWSSLTADEINNWIASKNLKNSPFTGAGEVFVKAAEQSGLDPRYIVAHAAVESGWGTSNIARKKHNYFGIGAFDTNPNNAYTFSTDISSGFADGIIEGAKWIARNYYNGKYAQTSVYTMRYNNNVHQYCTSDTWVNSIGSIMATAPANTKLTLAQDPVELNVGSTTHTSSSGKEHGGSNGTFGDTNKGKSKGSIGGVLSVISNAFSSVLGRIFNGGTDDETEEANDNQENEQFTGLKDSNSSGILGTSGDASGETVNGFPYYNQTEDPWKTVPYGEGSTIKSSGCGPTSAAMILKSYGSNVTPKDAAEYSLNNNFRVPGQGTSWSFFDSIGKQAGLTTEQFTDPEQAKQNLSNNIPVIASMKPGDFTDGGHFMVLSKLQDNQLYVNDPASRTRSAKIWDADYALNQAKQFWAISKDGVGSIGNVAGSDNTNITDNRNRAQLKWNSKGVETKRDLILQQINEGAISAKGSGLLHYGPSKAGNYILRDSSRNYYKKSPQTSGGASGSIDLSSMLSGNNLLDLAKTGVKKTSNAARNSSKETIATIPTNVAAISNDTSEMNQNIKLIAEAVKAIGDAVVASQSKKPRSSEVPNPGTNDAMLRAIQELSDITASINTI